MPMPLVQDLSLRWLALLWLPFAGAAMLECVHARPVQADGRGRALDASTRTKRKEDRLPETDSRTIASQVPPLGEFHP